MLWALTGAQWLTIGWTVLTLVVLEGLLSADNALVLAMMVRHLPATLQKRALRYGIWGAFFFRLLAVAFASVLLDFWIFEILGGAYLCYLAFRHFAGGEEHRGTDPASKRRQARGFWGTVVAVEFADIAFSVDSILAAVGLGDGLPNAIKTEWFLIAPIKLWVVYIGGVLGIITMRYVAGMFLRLLERFPGLAEGAYMLVAWIGLKLIGSGSHRALHPVKDHALPAWHDWVPGWVHSLPLEMSPVVFWSGMALIVVASFVLGSRHRRSTPNSESEEARAATPADPVRSGS